MHKLNRHIYLDKLKKLKDKHIIKIITGVRRCGKSTLLLLYYDYLIKNLKIDENKIIFLKFDDKKNEKIKDPNSLYSFLKNIINKDGSKYYLLLDEIQDVDGFESIILDFYEKGNVDIYLTGSNSYMLSGQIATKFTGRCIQIHILPFSFKEFVEFKTNILKSNIVDKLSLFNEYRKYGGFPITISLEDAEEKINWLNELYKQSLDKDILPYFQIKDKIKFKKVTKYIFENVANITSSNNIASEIHKDDNQSRLDHKTIDEYIDCLCEAFLLYEVKRYDIKGKEALRSKAKYYAVDMGLRNCVIGNTLDINRAKTIENIIFLELIRRGYSVHVGYVDRLEIDFVAVKGEEKIYIQVCDSIEKDETLKKELAPLISLKNSYKKYLIVGNDHIDGDNNGIKIINCVDFLLN